MNGQSSEKKLMAEVQKKENQISELLVVIDTAQAALRRAKTAIKDEEDKNHVFNPSAEWVLKFKI